MIKRLWTWKFSFGETLFEIEVETTDAIQARQIVEERLKQNNIHYAYSKYNKFVRMLKGTLKGDDWLIE